MCSIEAHEKRQKSVNEKKPVNNNTSSCGARTLPYISTEESLKSFGLTLNFIESWLK